MSSLRSGRFSALETAAGGHRIWGKVGQSCSGHLRQEKLLWPRREPNGCCQSLCCLSYLTLTIRTLCENYVSTINYRLCLVPVASKDHHSAPRTLQHLSGNCQHQPVCWYGRQDHRLCCTLIRPAASSHRRPALGCGVRGQDEIYALCNPNIATPLPKLPTKGAHLVIPKQFPIPALEPSIASRSDRLQFDDSLSNHNLSAPDKTQQ